MSEPTLLDIIDRRATLMAELDARLAARRLLRPARCAAALRGWATRKAIGA